LLLFGGIASIALAAKLQTLEAQAAATHSASAN